MCNALQGTTMNLLKHFKQFGIILVLVITCINPAFTQLNFWQQTNGPYGGDIRWMMAADSGRLYVWTNSFNGIGKGELSYSKDAGKNWELVEYPGEVILALCRTSHGKIVIATDNGLFRSDSNGAVWVSIADSLPLNSYIYHMVCINVLTTKITGVSSIQMIRYFHSAALLQTQLVLLLPADGLAFSHQPTVEEHGFQRIRVLNKPTL